MKKFKWIVFAVVLCLSMASCGGSGNLAESSVYEDTLSGASVQSEEAPTPEPSSELLPSVTEATSDATETIDATETTTLQTDQTEPASSEAESRADSTSQSSGFSVRFIDVGQADAALIECDGHYMLIDGGEKDDSRLMYTLLKNMGISYLDMVVGTHAHEDHIGGLAGALNYASAGLTLCPVTDYPTDAFDDFEKYAVQNGNGISVPSVGDVYMLGSATVTVLGVNADDDTNNTSIVLKVQYGETSFLFTGDAEREAEQAILNSGADLSATVLKVGHHGSETSTTYPFLREIMPLYAVISVGEDNVYGHPTDNTLSRLRDADVTVFRTDLHGDICFTSDGKTVSVTTEEAASEQEVMTPGRDSAAETPDATTASERGNEAGKTECSYVANKNTKKFHYPSCSSVGQMKEENKLYYTGSRDSLISQGYKPCGNCRP